MDDTDFVTSRAETLEQLATHFSERDWVCDSNLGDLEAIRYNIPEDRLWGRITSAVRWLFRPTPGWMKRMFGWDDWRVRLTTGRLGMAWYAMHRDRHLPDCQLDGGNVLVYWVETGWYLQMVQPKIGALIAEWMRADPTSPHALAIAKEMQRIDALHFAQTDATKAFPELGDSIQPFEWKGEADSPIGTYGPPAEEEQLIANIQARRETLPDGPL